MGPVNILAPTSENILQPASLTDSWHRIVPHNYLAADDRIGLSNMDVRFCGSSSSGAQMDVSSRFGRRVRELRQQRNLTQTEMAKRFGIDRSYISDLERGRKSISLPMIEVIALGMDISLSCLFDNL